MQDLAATVETLLAEIPPPLAPNVHRHKEMAARIAGAWRGVGGTNEGIEPFVRYWLTTDREWHQLLDEQKANARRAIAAAFRGQPRDDDAA